MVSIQRNRERRFKGNTLAQSCEQAREREAVFVRPIADALSFSKGSDLAGRSAVAGLFPGRAPSAILWRVITVCVDAVQRVIRRGARPHVGEKRFKGSRPSVTDGNSSCPVILVAVHARVKASSFHCSPYAVFGAVSQIMSAPHIAHAFTSKTTAGFRAFAHVMDWNRDFCAAIAAANVAMHQSFSRTAWEILKNRQSTESKMLHNHMVAPSVC